MLLTRLLCTLVLIRVTEGCRCEYEHGQHLIIKGEDCGPEQQVVARECLQSYMPDFAMLTMHGFHLPSMPQQIRNATDLWFADLSCNSFKVLKPEDFAQNQVLRTLNLSNNAIEEIEANTFRGLSYLAIIDLGNNSIHTVHPQAFDGMGDQLLSLDLSNNKLKEIDVWALSLLMSTGLQVTLDLSKNSIVRSTNVGGLEFNCIDLPLPSSYAKNRLILTRNKINHLVDILEPWGLATEKAAMCIGGPISLLGFMDFNDNPLICDCKDYVFYKARKTSGPSQFFDSLKCTGPFTQFPGDYLHNIDLQAVTCFITKDCPPRAMCVQSPSIAEITVRASGAETTSLPTYLPPLPSGYSYALWFGYPKLNKLEYRDYLNHTRLLSVSGSSKDFEITVEALKAFTSIPRILLINNNLSTLPSQALSLDWSGVDAILLGNNSWLCDCTTGWLQGWMKSFGPRLADPHAVECVSPEWNAGENVMKLPADRFTCAKPRSEADVYYDLLITGGTLVVALILAAVTYETVKHNRVRLYLKYGWHPFDQDECEGEDKEFDAFISYSNEDYEWARSLIEFLQKDGYKICFHELHFDPGVPISVNVERAIHQSKRTICSVSRHFMESEVCMSEFTAARSLDVNHNTHRLIMVLLEDIPLQDMKEEVRAYAKAFTYIARDAQFFCKRLKYRLASQRLGPEDSGREWSCEETGLLAARA